MRQQYHVRTVNQQKWIWNVNKLLVKTAHLQAKPVALTQIKEVDECYWFEQGAPVTCRDLVQHMQLVEQADLAYPILLCAQGRLIDGMHRVAKALLFGHTHILTIQLTHEIAPDYIDVDLESLPYDD